MAKQTECLQAWERQGLIWKAKLSPAQKLILLAYDSFANSEGTSCFPSYGTIATLTGYSKRTVIATVNELVKLKILKRTRRKTCCGGNNSNDYTIVYKALRSLVIQDHHPSDPISLPSDPISPPPSDPISLPSDPISPDQIHGSSHFSDLPSVCEARKNLTTDNANSPHTIEFEITDTLTDTEPVANSFPVNSNQTGVEPEDLDLPAVPPQIFSAAPAVFSPSPSETASISAEKQIQVSNDIQPVNGVLRGNFGAIVPLGKFLEVYNRSCGNWKPLSVAPAPAIVQGISAYRTRFVGTDDEFFKFFPLLIQAAQRSGGWFKQKLSPSQVFNAERLPLLDVWDEASKPDPVVHAVPVPNNFNHVQFENFL